MYSFRLTSLSSVFYFSLFFFKVKIQIWQDGTLSKEKYLKNIACLNLNIHHWQQQQYKNKPKKSTLNQIELQEEQNKY